MSRQCYAQGTWTKVVNQAPEPNGGGMLLLTDGTVIAKSFPAGGGFNYGDQYYRLTPDSLGSYVNGTWSAIAPMNKTRLYYSSQVLMDGRVYIAGGEYGSGNARGETYDPLTNIWTMTPNPGTVSDANSEILPDGKVLQAEVTGNLKKCKIYDPATNSYAPAPDCLGIHNESTWVKLPDSSILMVNRGDVTSERFIPALGEWIADSDVPVQLYDQSLLETGAGLLLPDGRALFFGSQNHTAYYQPSGDTTMGIWTAGPNIPAGQGQSDGPAAMLPDGKILLTLAPQGSFSSPTKFYEFDYLTNTFTQLSTPAGNESDDIPCYVTGMIVLPTGQVLCGYQDSTNYYVYTPAGAPIPDGKPTITGITQNGCTNSYTLTGMLFNGISEGAAYGDDWQIETNYPIVRLTNGNKVYYGRTHNWNSTGVQRGTQADTAQLDLPANLPIATYSLVVIANGFASDPITFSPFGAAITTADSMLCEGEAALLSANAGTGLSYQWQQDGLDIPGETSTTYSADVAGSYAVVVSNVNGCDTTSNSINITVSANPVIYLGSDTTVCDTSSFMLDAGSGFVTYDWSTGASTQTIDVNATDTYTVTVTNASGCTASDAIDVTVTICTDVTAIAAAPASFTVSPNPNSGQFMLDLELGDGTVNADAQLEIINVTGQIIYSKPVAIAGGRLQQEIALPNQADGMYLAKVLVNGAQLIKQVVVVK